MVVSISKNIGTRGLPFLDLIQEGTSGSSARRRTFDYRKGFNSPLRRTGG